MAQTPDIRWRQRLQSFKKAFGQSAAAVELVNQRAFTYNEKTAAEIATAIKLKFHPEFSAFLAKFTELEAMEP